MVTSISQRIPVRILVVEIVCYLQFSGLQWVIEIPWKDAVEREGIKKIIRPLVQLYIPKIHMEVDGQRSVRSGSLYKTNDVLD